MSKSIDLTTRYLGFTLKNPLIASASPMNTSEAYLKSLEEAGIAAIVLPSLFQEQIENVSEEYEALAHYNSPEASEYLPSFIIDGPYGVGPSEYLELIKTAKKAVSIPVIASLNGYSNTGWIEYAQRIQDAGADALELNLYAVPTDITKSSQQIEDNYIEMISHVRKNVTIPLSVKLCPYFTSIGFTASRMVEAGANGLVLFNRIMHPDIDTHSLQLDSKFTLTSPSDGQVALQWIGLLAKRVRCSLAASTGVDDGEQIVKYLLAGADVVMTTSSLLRHGPHYATVLLDELCRWLKAHDQTGLDIMRGQMSWQKLKNNDAYERSLYIKSVGSFRKY